MHTTTFFALVALPFSFAKNISISVGQTGLVFDPATVTANVGDLLQFSFYPKDHSVAQSSSSSPCQPLTGGVYSGFMPETAEGTTLFQVTVNDTNAIYLYCSQGEHCQNGMAMVVNPPSADSLANYQTAAKSTTSKSPPAIAGGVFMDATSNSTSNSTSGASSTASTSSTSSTASSKASTAAVKGGAAANSFVQWGLLGGAGISGLVLAIIS